MGGAVKRMAFSKQELLEKLGQLEEQARLGIHEYPQGLILERLRYVAALSRLLRMSVERDLEEEQRPRVIAIQRPEETR
jgi:hypothetical protein